MTHCVLQVALSRVDREQASVVRLKLAELRFCDAHGGWLLVDLMAEVRRRGGIAGIDDPSPAVTRLLRLISTADHYP
jgi:anti-anti-sigma regulatory factor